MINIQQDLLRELAQKTYRVFVNSIVKLVLVAVLIAGWSFAKEGHPIIGFLLALVALGSLDIAPWLRNLLRVSSPLQ